LGAAITTVAVSRTAATPRRGIRDRRTIRFIQGREKEFLHDKEVALPVVSL
jgi:hypothetical protein